MNPHKALNPESTLLSAGSIWQPGDAGPGAMAHLLTVLSAPEPGGFLLVDGRGHRSAVSYAAVAQRARSLLPALREAGLAPGHVLVICTEDRGLFLAALWACLLADLTALPLEVEASRTPARQVLLQAVLEGLAAQPHWHVLGTSTALTLPRWRAILPASRWVALRPDAPAAAPLPAASAPTGLPAPEHVRLLIPTSGTTGKPALVELSDRAVVARWWPDGPQLTPGKAFLSWAPVDHVMGLSGCSPNAGLKVLQHPDHFLRDPLAWLELAAEHRITHATMTSFGMRLILEAASKGSAERLDRLDLGSIQAIGLGAEALQADVFRGFAALLQDRGADPSCFVHSYGLTECGPLISGRPLHGQPARPDEPMDPDLCLDQVADGHALRIAAVEGTAVLYDGPAGEIEVWGPSMASGYWGQQGHPNGLFSVDGWLRTGDLGQLSDGRLRIVGRIKEVLMLHALQVPCRAVEAIAERHPHVGAAYAVQLVGGAGSAASSGYVLVITPPAVADHQPSALDGGQRTALLRWIQDHLAREFGPVPAQVVLLPAGRIPRTALGKPSRHRLAALLEEVLSDPPTWIQILSGTRFQDPRDEATATERAIAGLWADVLGHDRFSFSDHFFAVGGDSLAVVRLIGLLEQEVYEASPAQSGLWILHQMEPGLTAYQMPLAWRLLGELNVEVLCGAIRGLVERHAPLRTSFRMGESGPVQVIHPPWDVALEVEEMTGGTWQEVMGNWLEEEGERGFDLGSGVLLRSRLLRVSEREYVLLVNHHHLASDGWSCSVLSRDLTRLYNAGIRGVRAELPELRVRYPDYAHWLNRRLRGQRLEELVGYWVSELKDLEPLELPRDHARPSRPSGRGGVVSRSIGLRERAGLVGLCREEGATVQMGWLALVALVLHRHSGQTSVGVGVPNWGRDQPELEDLIGMFINMLPIRIDFDGAPTFRELLSQVRERALSAYDHRELPFERMVEVLQPLRDPSRNPLVQVMVQVLDLPESRLGPLDGVRVEAVECGMERAKFDLSFVIRESGEGWALTINYASDLFERERIERMAAHVGRLLEAVLSDADGSCEELPLLPASEREQIEGWQEGERVEVADVCVHALFEERVRAAAGATALIVEGRAVSYGELNRRANAVAAELLERGVEAGEVVGVCLERSEDLVASLLGVLKAGGAYVPLDPEWPWRRRRDVLRDAGCRRMVSRAELWRCEEEGDGMGSEVMRVDPGEAWERWRNAAERNRGVAVDPSQVAYILYTSGSTGAPKGVLVSHAALMARVPALSALLDLEPAVRVLAHTSAAFDIAFVELLIPLTQGSTIVLVNDQQRRDPEQILRQLERHRVRVLQGTPTFLRALVMAGLPRSAQRIILAGGEVLEPVLARQLLRCAGRVLNGYGPTEATIYCTAHQLDFHAPVVPIGRPLAGTRVRILDSMGRLCPIGVPGELEIGGAGVSLGYWQRPDLNATRFVANPNDPALSPPAWFRSGDVTSWAADGTLTFHGRIDEQVKLRGFRIEPGEIEVLLRSHHAVADAVVQLRHDDYETPCLTAYWRPSTTSESRQDEDLASFLAERLPSHMVPSAFVPLAHFPLTSSGKVDRQALPEPRRSAAVEARQPPSSALEHRLWEIWQEVLGHPDFGTTDDFFLLGGHSLSAVRVASRLRQTMGVDLAVTVMFQQRTISALARQLEGMLKDPPSAQRSNCVESEIQPAERIGVGTGGEEVYEASPAQSGLWILHQMEPGLTAYQMPLAWRLLGELNVEVLCGAIRGLVERHAPLRTSFRMGESGPVQVIHPPWDVALEVEEMTGGTWQEVMGNWLEEEGERGFDLGSGVLLRSRLLRVSEREYVLLVNHHHLASDGWSCSVLSRDLTRLYNAGIRGVRAELPELRVRYPDYAHWLNRRLRGQRLEELVGYWVSELKDLEPLELPRDHARPSRPSGRGGVVSRSIGLRERAGLVGLCREEGATVQMGWLALVALVLHRHSGQTSVGVGVPNWGRDQPELEDLIGMFINMLPIRIDFDGAPTFRELLSQVRERALSAYDHRELPFERMVEVLQPLRDPSRNPLVQVMVQVLDLPESRLGPLDGVRVEAVECGMERAKFDLSFVIRESGEGWALTINYASDLFERERIERMAAHVGRLLEAVLSDADGSCEELPLLPASEREQIEGWQEGERVEVADVCVHALFEERVRAAAGATALIVEGRAVSYGELNRRANAVAAELLERGVEAGEVVGVCLERSEDLVASLLGVLKAGGAYVPLDPEWPWRRRRDVLRDAGCRRMVSRAELWRCEEEGDGMGSEVMRVDPGEAWERWRNAAERNRGVAVDPSQVAYILYTSGSTGAPKGVAVPHRAIADRCQWYPQLWGLDHRSRVLAQSGISFDMGTREWLMPLTVGATVVLATQYDLNDPEAWVQLAHEADCSHLAATPSRWKMVLPHLHGTGRVLLAGGERLGPDLCRAMLDQQPERLIHSYGPSEVSIACTLHGVSMEELEDSDPVPLGSPLPNTQLHVLDSVQNPCPIGVPGELWIGGRGLAIGYWNDPKLTEEKFQVCSDNLAGVDRLYRTGDVVSWDASGRLRFHGRADQQIKLRGYRIEPAEIEAVLNSCPGVSQSAVLLKEQTGGDARLIGFCVLEREDPPRLLTAQDLRGWLLRRLPTAMIPAVFRQLDALPLTSRGKLDREQLLRLASDPSMASPVWAATVPPSNDLERLVHDIWSDVLGHREFGVADNFFAIGGHSLAAIRVVARINHRLSTDIALSDFFEEPAIQALCPRISDRTDLCSEPCVSYF